MAKISTTKVLLSLAANMEWPLQLDVKNAFLISEFGREAHMNLPLEFE